MTLLTVSNQGFTVHNHMCGINFLSHLKGAPQSPRQSGMPWDDIAQTYANLGYPGEGGGVEKSGDRKTKVSTTQDTHSTRPRARSGQATEHGEKDRHPKSPPPRAPPPQQAKTGLAGVPGRCHTSVPDHRHRHDRKNLRPLTAKDTKDQNLERNFLYVVCKSSGSTRVSPTALMKFTSPNQRGRICMWM